MSETNDTKFIDVYQLVTDQITAQLSKGIIPWHKPWGSAGTPQNLVTKHQYQGINLLLLAMLDYPTNYYMTWEQLKKVNGSVKKGEKGHLVVVWKRTEKKVEGKEEPQISSFLRYFKVFNTEQCVNIPENLMKSTHSGEQKYEVIPECEAIVAGMPNKPVITHKGKEAWYDPVSDTVNLPPINRYDDAIGYYGTLFHEIVHSTGSEKRLKRPSLQGKITFGSPTYSQEELVAELGSCFLLSLAGAAQQTHIINSAAYIQGWLKQLNDDKKFVVQAATLAEKATKYILNKQGATDGNEEG